MIPDDNDLREQYDRQFFDQEVKSTFDWLVRFVYRYGWTCGIDTHKEMIKSNSGVSIVDWILRPEKFSLSWYISRGGCLDVRISDDNWHGLSHAYYVEQEGTHRVLGRNELNGKEDEFIVSLAQAIDQIILRFLPGIRQVTGVRFCSSCYSLASVVSHRLAICTPLGDKWLCDDCLNRYSLNAKSTIPPRETKRERSEREKMTVSLRYTILERDHFACKIYGRSYLRGDNIKLHVDHITPIAKGGKTEPNNLQTLCDDCNLGKGTRTFEQA
jgi:hypothetical protein